MKIRFLKDTNIRDGLPEFSGKIIGVVLSGVELEIDEEIISDRLFNGVATWYRDGRDWYYWGGAVAILEGAPPVSTRGTAVEGGKTPVVRDRMAVPPLPEGVRRKEQPPAQAGRGIDLEPTGPATLTELRRVEEEEPLLEDAQDLAYLEPFTREEDSPPVKEPLVPPEEEKRDNLKAAGPPSLPELRRTEEEEGVGKTEPEAEAEMPVMAPPPLPATPAGSGWDAKLSREVFDPLRMSWAVRDLQIDRLWREYRLTGEGVYIALLDTGIDARHPDLEGRVLGGRNFCDPGSEDITDEDGRGTRCAGLIAGQGRQGVLGIAPAAGLYVGKVMRNTFDLSFDRLVQGLQWAIQQPVDIIVVGMDLKPSSLTADQRQVLAGIAGSIAERGVLLVAPVGQSSLVKPEDRLPASLEYCLSVGAVDQQHRRYKQSLRSYTLDVAAPGADLLTTASGGGADPAFSGPDAAAAVAAGALALVAQRMHEIQTEWTIADLRQAIRETAVSAAGPGGQGRTVEAGFGLLNPWGVLEKIG